MLGIPPIANGCLAAVTPDKHALGISDSRIVAEPPISAIERRRSRSYLLAI